MIELSVHPAHTSKPIQSQRFPGSRERVKLEHWQPRVVGRFNDNDLMVVDIQMRNETVTLGPGEIFVVPKGVEHRPVADEEAHVLLIEPQGTPNTGDARTAASRRTKLNAQSS